MSQSGQVASRFSHAIEVSLHSHREALLVVSLQGTATLGVAGHDFAVPARAMLWIAGNAPHRVRTTADYRSLILAFPPDVVARPTGVIEATGFVHDLVDRVRAAPDPERHARLAAVLVEELAVPIPAAARLARLTALVASHPSLPVAALCRAVGMSERAFRRWFRASVGTTFTHWHQALLVDRAIAALRLGDSVKAVAIDLGYNSPSAFVAMFKRATSVPPQRYLRSRLPDSDV